MPCRTFLSAVALFSVSASAAQAAESVTTTRLDPVAPAYQTPVVAVIDTSAAQGGNDAAKHRFTVDLSLESGTNTYWQSGDFKSDVPASQAYQLEFQPRLSLLLGDRLALGVHGLVGLEVPTLRKKADLIAGAGVSAGVRFYPTAHTIIQPTMDSSYIYHRTDGGVLENHGMRLTARLDFFAKVCHHTHLVVGPYVKQNVIEKHDEARSIAYGMRLGYVTAF